MNKKGELLEVLGILIFVILFLGYVGYSLAYAFTYGQESIVIKEKWTKFSGEDAKYLVSSEDGQVFEISDSWIKMRFDSSNLYADIEKGQKCSIETQGWRFGLFSDYKNILKADCVIGGNSEQ